MRDSTKNQWNQKMHANKKHTRPAQDVALNKYRKPGLLVWRMELRDEDVDDGMVERMNE